MIPETAGIQVLIVHMRYQPDPTGTAPLVTQLAQDLVRQGAGVSVVTSLPHYGRTSVHPDFQNKNGFFDRREEQRIDVIRTPVYVPKHPGFFQRLLNYLTFTLNSIWAGIRVRNVDVVLAVNPPITTAYSAYLLKLLHRADLVLSIQDVWPDCLVEVGQLKNRLLIQVLRLVEILQYMLADRIVVLSEGMKTNLLHKNVPEEKLEIVSNWADTERVVPIPRENSFSRNHQLQESFNILFAGNHGYNAALMEVLQAAEKLQDHPDIQFVFAGEGSVKADLLAAAERWDLQNVLFLGTQPEADWLEMLAACDLGLVPLRKGLGRLNVPSKVYTLMAAARPILASVPRDSEIARIIHRVGCGFVTEPQDPERLVHQIQEAFQNQDDLPGMGQRGRKYLVGDASRKIQTSRYYEILREKGTK